MAKRIDLIGRKFNRLLVLGFSHKGKWGHSYWRVRCDCGNEKVVENSHLKRGKIKSCGCLRGTGHNGGARQHGMSGTKIYYVWADMKKRCLHHSNKDYKYYGARGIVICERWLSSFKNFFEDMGEIPKGLTLDRINNDGNYEPDNCKWATRKEQANNRRNSKVLKLISPL